jgi:hypothetical protein
LRDLGGWCGVRRRMSAGGVRRVWAGPVLIGGTRRRLLLRFGLEWTKRRTGKK